MQESISRRLENIASKSKTDNILIVGKGPSVDRVNWSAIPDGIIINLNDSERIHAGDIGIFSANWVRHSLNEGGFRCGYYLAGKPLPMEVQHDLLPPVPIELDQEELTTARLEKEEFYDESFVLLNAFKVALQIHRTKGTPQKVYLLGFDFSVKEGVLSHRAGPDYSGATTGERDAIVSAQEHELLQFLHYFENGARLEIIHVGSKAYSKFSSSNFSRLAGGAIEPEPRGPINYLDPDRVLIVAELTNNHLGNRDRLIEMVHRSADAGADLIKVQKRDVNSFYSKEQLDSYYWSPFGKTLQAYREGVELNNDLLELLDSTCKAVGIEWFCSVLDLPSYRIIQRFNPRLVKLPSTISNRRKFLIDLAAEYDGPIVISTGFTEQEYVEFVLEHFGKNEVTYLLHCVSAYPTPQADCNISIVRSYASLVNQGLRVIPGYSSHDLGNLGSMLAVSAGARMIEKHVKLGDVEWVHFDKVAIDLETVSFANFVSEVRLAERAVGTEKKKVLPSEHHKY